jgi:phosphoglycolate phosphatase-like HAD superfamily hydrolase
MPLPPLVIFDLDGTLSDASHRVHLLDKKRGKPDWRAFYAACVGDTVHLHTKAVARALLNAGHEMWLFSGRSDEVYSETLLWLADNGLDFFHRMRFRQAGDYTADDILKMNWYDEMEEGDRARLMVVFDDRDRMVRAWRLRGVPCFQVAEGDF